MSIIRERVPGAATTMCGRVRVRVSVFSLFAPARADAAAGVGDDGADGFDAELGAVGAAVVLAVIVAAEEVGITFRTGVVRARRGARLVDVDKRRTEAATLEGAGAADPTNPITVFIVLIAHIVFR